MILDILKVGGILFAGFVLFFLAFGAAAGTSSADYRDLYEMLLEGHRRRSSRFWSIVGQAIARCLPAQARTDVVENRCNRLTYDIECQIKAAKKLGLPTEELEMLLERSRRTEAAWHQQWLDDAGHNRSLHYWNRGGDQADQAHRRADEASDAALRTAILIARARLELEAAGKELPMRRDAAVYSGGYYVGLRSR